MTNRPVPVFKRYTQPRFDPSELALTMGEVLRSKLASLGAPSCEEQEAIWDLIQPAPVPAVTEPERPALTWNKPATVDRFPGFTVQASYPLAPAHRHPLQKLHEANPKHGSAHLIA